MEKIEASNDEIKFLELLRRLKENQSISYIRSNHAYHIRLYENVYDETGIQFIGLTLGEASEKVIKYLDETK